MPPGAASQKATSSSRHSSAAYWRLLKTMFWTSWRLMGSVAGWL
jgi:hypothetical protein